MLATMLKPWTLTPGLAADARRTAAAAYPVAAGAVRGPSCGATCPYWWRARRAHDTARHPVATFLELLRAIFARVTYSRDPVLTFRSFWRAMQDHYAFLEPRRVDWQLVRQLFGDTIQPATSDDDLWIALQESVSLCDDPSLAVSRVAGAAAGASGPRTLTARGHKLPTAAALRFQQLTLAAIEREHLTHGGRRIANNRFVCGILNAETCPGWRIGYICLTAMQVSTAQSGRSYAFLDERITGYQNDRSRSRSRTDLLDVDGKPGEEEEDHWR
ncbi:ClpP/crotonase-like domain [Phytophthora cactorum]|nr:ClpP/crotonase-like domain [Phytophthora cactorum]